MIKRQFGLQVAILYIEGTSIRELLAQVRISYLFRYSVTELLRLLSIDYDRWMYP